MRPRAQSIRGDYPSTLVTSETDHTQSVRRFCPSHEHRGHGRHIHRVALHNNAGSSHCHRRWRFGLLRFRHGEDLCEHPDMLVSAPDLFLGLL